MRKVNILSSFILKVVAILAMTIDHIGFLIGRLANFNMDLIRLAEVFRIIGRLAMPLFIFMIVEGVIHTKDIKKYFLRLGIMAALISVVYILMEYVPYIRERSQGLLRAGNIFLDLLVVAFAIWSIRQEGFKKLFILLPIAIAVSSFVVKGIENSTTTSIYWLPFFLTMRYDIIALLWGIGFYFSYLLADIYIKSLEPTTGMDKSIWVENGNYRLAVNIISTLMLIAVSVLYYSFYYIWPNAVFNNARSASIQLTAIVSGAFILLYSGKRGYNSKWFQYGCYLYYPLHIATLLAIYIIINGGI